MRGAAIRAILVLIVGVMATVPAQAAASEEHVVAGVVQLHDGSWLGLDVVSHPESSLRGRAWLGEGLPPAVSVDVALDCIEVTWRQPVYPIPPYLPHHVVRASGLGTDGVRYFITAYDALPRPLGFGDHASVVTVEPLSDTCGAGWDAAPIDAGDLVVSP